jgi:polyhydroxyalkanoate synthesis regulator phasin
VGRKSTIARGPEEVRKTIDKLIRKGQLTLAEMRQYVADHHGEEHAPSLSGLHRYKAQVENMMARHREHDQIARIFVAEIGESTDDRKGEMLIQMAITLLTDIAMRSHGDDVKVTIEDARKLARAINELTSAQDRQDKRRIAIERRAVERLQSEQSERLDQVAAEQGLSPEQIQFWRHDFLGIAKAGKS